MTPNVVLMLNYVKPKESYTTSKQLNKFSDKRDFYSCNKHYNYVSYVQSGSQSTINYVDYSGNNEKSKGIFNQYGLLNEISIKQLKRDLSKTKSCIWHGVISFESDFGNTFCITNEQAIKLMQSKLPRFFNKINLDPKNIVWFAGLHENTDNKHIHFSFFEINPTKFKNKDNKLHYSNGKVSLDAINEFKVEIELGLTDWTNKIALVRENLTQNYKTKFKNNNIALTRRIKTAIDDLSEILAETRLFYGNENIKPFQQDINYITNLIIKSSPSVESAYKDFIKQVLEKESQIRDICRKNKVSCKRFLISKKYVADINRRLGNILLANIQDYRKYKQVKAYKTKNYYIQKRIRKTRRLNLARKLEYLSNAVINEAFRAFDEYQAKLKEMDFKRLVEEGVIEL